MEAWGCQSIGVRRLGPRHTTVVPERGRERKQQIERRALMIFTPLVSGGLPCTSACAAGCNASGDSGMFMSGPNGTLLRPNPPLPCTAHLRAVGGLTEQHTREEGAQALAEPQPRRRQRGAADGEQAERHKGLGAARVGDHLEAGGPGGGAACVGEGGVAQTERLRLWTDGAITQLCF
jgi:hypothetical protein